MYFCLGHVVFDVPGIPYSSVCHSPRAGTLQVPKASFFVLRFATIRCFFDRQVFPALVMLACDIHW